LAAGFNSFGNCSTFEGNNNFRAYFDIKFGPQSIKKYIMVLKIIADLGREDIEMNGPIGGAVRNSIM